MSKKKDKKKLAIFLVINITEGSFGLIIPLRNGTSLISVHHAGCIGCFLLVVQLCATLSSVPFSVIARTLC